MHDFEVVPIGECSDLATVTGKIFGLMEAWHGSGGSRTTSFALPKAGAS
jgi:hypothetical protein